MRLRAPVAAVVAVSLLAGCLLVLSRNKEHFVAALGQNYVYEPKNEVPDSSKKVNKASKDTVFRVRKENAVVPAKPEVIQKDKFVQKDASVLPPKDDMLKLAQPDLAAMYHGFYFLVLVGHDARRLNIKA
ncbi:hypothetical protein FSP39_011402 [Pinctada imbricata]|uniref:Uncharacterized protein n=1 Tax=Pinctada imbricata TaxID=66713 RepID=A0AA89BPC5_PINIB|nr:hypothetical protein FSP39_011402 [Pinctada imbricata]